MKNCVTYKISIVLFTLFIFNCKEQIELETENFESILVVEATITDEFKQQEIKLSRTVPLEEGEIAVESNAIVKVIENNTNEYTFSLNNSGVYVSDVEFQGQENLTYKLEVMTSDGKVYESLDTNLTPSSNIDNLYAEVSSDGETVNVLIDSGDDNGIAQYFRYEYEETYKIIAPRHSLYDATIVNFMSTAGDITYDVDITEREQEERICYSSNKSNSILLSSTTGLEDNVVSRHIIRSIPINDPIIRARYSILAKQYTQSIQSHTFYKTINDLGSLSSLLSESQPGFVAGNIVSTTNSNEKTIGYFEVSSMTTQRIYFNFTDFNLSLPDYFYECTSLELDYNDNTNQDNDPNERVVLYQLLTSNNYKLFSFGSSIYIIVNPECGDCTSFSSNVQPDFWED